MKKIWSWNLVTWPTAVTKKKLVIYSPRPQGKWLKIDSSKKRRDFKARLISFQWQKSFLKIFINNIWMQIETLCNVFLIIPYKNRFHYHQWNFPNIVLFYKNQTCWFLFVDLTIDVTNKLPHTAGEVFLQCQNLLLCTILVWKVELYQKFHITF